MTILLDTDHVTVLHYFDHPRCMALSAKLNAAGNQRLATTAVTLEEQLRGWLAEIARWRDVGKQVHAHKRLTALVEFYHNWDIVAFDDRAAQEFERLKKMRLHIGSQDLKIASITLVQRALLLSANLRDFQKVPDLRVENWLE